MVKGILKVRLQSPALSLKALACALSKCPVGSFDCRPNCNNVSTCLLNCSKKRLGISPVWLCGPWTTALGKCWLIPIAGSVDASVGFRILWHDWASLKLVAINGYINLGTRTCLRLDSAFALLSFALAKCQPHSATTFLDIGLLHYCCHLVLILLLGFVEHLVMFLVMVLWSIWCF